MSKNTAEITTILCDDIRAEAGNKISLMGIYNQEITVPFLPFILPKLCLFVIIKKAQQNSIPSNFQVIVTGPISETINLEMKGGPKDTGKNKDSLSANIGIAISPFKIQSEGEAKIEIIAAGTEKPFAVHKFTIKKHEGGGIIF
ncbi:MAG: hypothetical protein NTY86_16270 [Deltaproteobacteria bacterium]|nr:hypothetical protein [Deltaproteobacteria bacterium]